MKAHEFMHEMRTTSAILGRSSGVSVKFEGDKANNDGKTITLPALPQQIDLTQEQVLAMRGYVDHEAGHSRHSDMPRVLSFYDKNHNNNRDDLSSLHNSLEDHFMERRVIDEYPGAYKNLRQCDGLVRTSELKTFNEMGQEKFKEHTTADPVSLGSLAINSSKNRSYDNLASKTIRNDWLPDSMQTMGDHWVDLAHQCANSDEVIELSKKVYQYLNTVPPEDQSPEDFDAKAEGDELSDLEGQEGEGEGTPEGQAAAAKGEKVKGKGEGQDQEGGLPNPSEDLADTLNSGDEAAGGIGQCVDNGLRGGYRVMSEEEDRYYERGKIVGDSHSTLNQIVNDTSHRSEYDACKSQLQSNVMVMKNKLRRALMSRQQRDWDFGRESGRLDSKRLVAASMRSPAVFKRRTDREDHDTAICILVDLSGSMYSKIAVARDCAIALSECFEGTSMSYKISGFSNNAGVSKNVRGQFHRHERLDHTVFKGYDDPLRVCRGSVYRIGDAVGGNNSDYDFIDKELFLLSRRPEKRKVLFVLSDGHVACRSDAPTSEHNRLIKENLKHYKSKYGVESVGIGIKSDAVKSLYPDHTVVRNVGELSGAAFGMLTTILFRDKG